MKILRIVGILVVIAGIVSLFVSNYISEQVEEGRGQVAGGERKVKQAQQLFSFNPVTKQVGEGLTGSAQKKIAMGKEQIAYYEQMAQTLQIGGIVGIVAGAGLFLFSFSKKKKR